MSRGVRLIVLCIFVTALAFTSEAQICTGGPNDVYTSCGSHCPPSCDEPRGGICIQSCKPDTCQCQRGYLRRYDGQCVTEAECDL
ncbi:chymotrypsin inhibitor-like [Venturia canescens]|uniref:chymotrypsin inhibitor-like n=1 Tax=Venturia canescens TaxID=32260 RepID=UPI001C9CB5AA|nr:chymotrypsin inhibitor-like [Venturia canescens]